jgi:hypothetical protein
MTKPAPESLTLSIRCDYIRAQTRLVKVQAVQVLIDTPRNISVSRSTEIRFRFPKSKRLKPS